MIDSLKKEVKITLSPKQKALIYLDIAKAYQKIQVDSSKHYSLMAKSIALSTRNDSLLAASYFRMAYPEYYNSRDDIALSYYNKIDSIANAGASITKIVIESKIYRSEISKFTLTMAGVLKAKEYLLEGLKLAKEIDNEDLINRLTQRLAAWHGFISQEIEPEKHLDSAKILWKKTLPYFERIKDYHMTAEIYWDLATASGTLKDYTNQKYYYNKRLIEIKKTGDSLKIAQAYANYGPFYRRINQPEKGLTYLDSASLIYNNIGYPNKTQKKNMHKDYAYLYEQKGDYKNAFLKMYEALVLKDTIFKEQNIQVGIDVEAKYQTEKKEQEIALLKTQNELTEQKQKSQRNILLGGIGLTSLAGLFLFVLYRNRLITNKKLRELDAAKSNFFANISHEFRTPLSLIQGPIEAQLERPDLTSKEERNLSIAKRNSNRLLELVDQLLDLSKLESNHYKLNISEGNLLHFLKSHLSSFEYKAEQKNQRFRFDITLDEKDYWFDHDVLQKIMTNLVSNALKYSPENKSIYVKAEIVNNLLNITINNTGIVLDKKELPHIFSRFRRNNEQETGTGIGLALTKELVELHKGNIKAKSDNDSVTFHVQLPINEVAFAAEELVEPSKSTLSKTVSQENTAGYSNSTEESTTAEGSNDAIILVVDDNPDLRAYVSSIFDNSHKIVTAENGKIGFEKALEQVPDLIITDLMMPEDDGLRLTENCKTHDTTSHIPIVMLTAKAGDENRLTGLETGADAYLTKPFNTKILKRTVNNLLESRKKLQERFSQEVILTPKDISVSSYDERFLSSLQEVLDTSLVESDFSAENFAKALSMSRMQLHRKLKALTGKTATEFIRSQRLKLAAQLLKKSEINVSEVGYTVGFNNHSYFTKCFKEQFGVSPSEYANS